jgi:hypothetical protein
VGTYAVSVAGSTDVMLRLDRQQDNLVMKLEGSDHEQALICEAPGKFFCIDLEGEKSLHFQGVDDAAYERCISHSIMGTNYEARRID